MDKIIALHLEALKNAQHFNFADFVKAATTKYTLTEGEYGKYINKFTAALDAEDEAYQKYDRKTLTARINKQNADRQVKTRLLREVIDAVCRTGSEDKRLAAERLQGAMELYGGVKIAALPMDSLTGVLTNLTGDFDDRYPEDVEAIGIAGQVENLKASNEAFKRLIAERTLADSEIGKEAMAKARAETDRTLRMLFDAINLNVDFGDAEAALKPFIAYLNTEINRYRILIGQGASGSASSGSAGDGEATVKIKNARFKFADGRTETFPVEVGSVLIAPTNTAGYEWKPAVPELMPATNKNFREVLIEKKEIVLTFHFLDHRDEEIRQPAGTVLEAPQNTPGCYWDPKVPAFVPDKDTSFYEFSGLTEGPGGLEIENA